MAVTVMATGNAVTTASRSPAITFSSYTPYTNDIIAFFPSSGAAAAAATQPTNWVLPTPASGANPVASDSHTYGFVYHVVTNAEHLSATTTYTATNFWNATQTGNVTGIVLRGVDQSAIVDSLVTAFDSTNTVTPHVLPALTGANLSTDSLVVRGVVKDATGTYTTPASHTARGSNNTNLGSNLYTHNTLTTSGANVSATNITPSAGDEYCSISVAFSARAVPAISTFTDDFSSLDSTKWLYGSTAAIVSNQLSLPCNGAYTSAGFSNGTYNLVGSEIYINLVQRSNAGNGTTNTYFLLQHTKEGNGAQNMVGYAVNQTDLLLYYKVAGSATYNGTTYNATNHAWLRFRESAGTVYWDTSPDCSTWTNVLSVANPIALTDLYVTLESSHYGAETTPGTAIYDSLNTPPPGMSGTLAAANQKATASFTGVMQPAGTLAAAQQKATGSFTGTQTQTGTLAAALQKATASMTGVMQPAGTLAAALQQATSALTGTQTQTGALAAALQPLLFTASGAQTQTGTLAATSQKATASLVGWMEPSGTLAASLQRATMSATGAQTQSGALAAAVQPLSASLTGTHAQSGALAAALQKATASLSGGVTRTGTLAASIQALAFAASGLQTQQGTLAAAIQSLDAGFAGEMPMTGTVSGSLDALVGQFTGAASDAPAALFATLQPLAASLSGTMLPSGALASVLQPLVFGGQGSQTLSGNLAAGLQPLSAALSGQIPFTGTLSGLLVPVLFAASGSQINDGVLSGELQELVAELIGSTPFEGVLSGLLPALEAELEGSGGVPIATLSASIAPLVFSSLAKVYRLALERLTVVEVADRLVHVSVDPRSVLVDAGARVSDIEVPARETAVTTDNRNTTVKREG